MNAAIVPIEQDKEWLSKADWLKRHDEHLAIRDQGGHNVVFIGDSITQGWGGSGLEIFKRDFESLGVANFGIGGDATQHVLWRIEHGVLDGLDPKHVSLLIGTNNLGNEGDNGPDTAEGVIAVFNAIREKLPNAHIVLNAVFPRAHEPDNPFRAEIEIINNTIRPLADADNVTWLDMHDAFVDGNNFIPEALMPDFLHLRPEAYDLWAQRLLPLINV